MVDDRFQQQVKDCESVLQSLLQPKPPQPSDALAASLAAQSVAAPAYKHALELAFRTTLHSLCTQTAGAASSSLTSLLELCIASTPALLDATLPFQLLEDTFDYTPLTSLPPLFTFLSQHSDSLASPALTQTRPRLSLLKACNGLLRRLSKTEGAEWSGELLELLSRMMAVDERGGLNATGKFHTDNHTPVHSQPTAADSTGDADSAVDYAFYQTLWSLQSFFADPPRLRQVDSLSSFLSSLDSVLTAFERSPTSAVSMSSAQSSDAYFPKYLSGPRLMHLQLQDSSFRRHLLTQALIIFQYLLNPTADAALTLPQLAASADSGRPSTAGSTATAGAAGGLSTSQTSSAKSALVRVLQLLGVKVSDDGKAVDSSSDKYGERLLELLRDELSWMRWKQAKAPSFTRPPTPLTAPIALPTPPAKPAKRSKRVKTARSEVQLMGGAKLSELWRDVASNEQSVRDGARNFAPDLEVKLKELLDEDDEWQLRVERWKKIQEKRAAVKKEKEQSEKKEEVNSEDRMEEDGGGDGEEDETEPDESELLRKNKQRAWVLLRLLRRSDFALFVKSEGKLDKVVDELKKRRKQAADKAAKEQSERSKVEEEVKEATRDAADGVEAAVAAVDEEVDASADEAKDVEAEKMEAGADEMAQGDEAAIELERKTEPAEDASGKELQEPEERPEPEPEREEEEDEEREEARSSRRGETRDEDSPRESVKRRSGADGSDEDDSSEGGKRQKVEGEAEAQPNGGEQAETAAAATDESAEAVAPDTVVGNSVDELASAAQAETEPVAAAEPDAAKVSAAADDADMQAAE